MDETGVDLQLDRAHSARMYDYYLGGRTNFPADREAVGRVLAVFPQALAVARANREFMHRSTRYLAERGLRQFLDIGTGIPTSPNLHEVAQAVAPEARVVYVDNDPIVLEHAKALLHSSPQGRTAYVQADLNAPAAILSAPALHETLDLGQPVALSLNAVLHFVPDDDAAYQIVEHLTKPLAPGSALVISHVTGDFSPAVERTSEVYRQAGTAAKLRTWDEIVQYFDGLDFVDPGLTATHRWRPDIDADLLGMTDREAAIYAGVAYKID
ncbi:MAG TPA: SAM-dependent methyltransferase [Actinocrinis sp.]|jgi:hypothetical protein